MEAISAFTPYSSARRTVFAATGMAARITGTLRRSGSDTNGRNRKRMTIGMITRRNTDMIQILISPNIDPKGRVANRDPITIIASGVVTDPSREIESDIGEGIDIPAKKNSRPINEAIRPGDKILRRSGFLARSGRRRKTPTVNTRRPKGILIRVT